MMLFFPSHLQRYHIGVAKHKGHMHLPPAVGAALVSNHTVTGLGGIAENVNLRLMVSGVPGGQPSRELDLFQVFHGAPPHFKFPQQFFGQFFIPSNICECHGPLVNILPK